MKMKFAPFALLLVCASRAAFSQESLEIHQHLFRIAISKNNGAVVRFERAGDPSSPNFVMSPEDHPEFNVADSRWFGDIVLRYRVGDGEWKHASTARSGATRHVSSLPEGRGVGAVVEYSGQAHETDAINGLDLKETYQVEGDALTWRIQISNQSSAPVEIGDLGLPLLFNSYYAKDPVATYTQRVIRHSYIEGDDSFIFWMRPDGKGPILLMTPGRGTHLEYFNSRTKKSSADAPDSVFAQRGAWEGLYTAYIHGKVQTANYDKGGSWRQPLTSRSLAPRGLEGSDRTYEFVFHWEDNYQGVRDELYRDGLLDIEVAPGMVIPSNLAAHLSIRTRQKDLFVEPEFPRQTKVRPEHSPDSTRSTYEIHFARLGENLITIRYGNGRRTQLEYFVTEPIEDMIKKRSAFLVRNQQIRDKSKWYDGEFVPWNMETRSTRTPDHIGDLDPYMTGGSDDPSLCKAPLIAAKNVLFPEKNEIESLEYYIDHFVWGKLQRTESESPFPFGVYGTPNWNELRNSKIGFDSGGNGREHMWRTFDYTHLVQLYFEMYRIAKLYPDLVHSANAEEYLSRAYGTAKAFFEIPYHIKMGEPWAFHGWTDWAYKQGNFHEVFIPDLIDALETEGHKGEATTLRIEWEKKVLYFLYDHPYPFGSEMYFDTTAFESTHAIADYAAQHRFDPHEASWIDRNSGRHYEHTQVNPQDVSRFMENEIRANIAARGSLESNYYELGSDIRQDGQSNYLLSYMTQMGGWSILDYGLQDVRNRIDSLRLGYASYLAGWADMNSGSPSSNYGFWFRGKENDGAAGWGFNPQKVGATWISHVPQIKRGIWPYDGEIDSGFSGSFRAASVIVARDPIFGLMAYGGDLDQKQGTYAIVCKDGIQQRVALFIFREPMEFVLTSNRFSSKHPILIKDGTSLSLPIEVQNPIPTSSELRITGLREGEYELSVDGRHTQTTRVTEQKRTDIFLHFETPTIHVVTLYRIAN